MNDCIKKSLDKIVNNMLSECISQIPADNLYYLVQKDNIALTKKCAPELSDTKGAIRKCGDKTSIAINTYRNYDKAENMSLAHEISHYYIWKSQELLEYYKKQQLIEEMAWYVAYEFLMPKEDFHIFFGSSSFDYHTLRSISARYKVSKFCAGVRYTQLIDDKRCAILQFENNRIKNYAKSKSFHKYISIEKDIFIQDLSKEFILDLLESSKDKNLIDIDLQKHEDTALCLVEINRG